MSKTHEAFLNCAQHYADLMSGCNKVAVGSVIVKAGVPISFGANRAVPDLCKYRGCLRVEKYGEDSKIHRNPEDCRAIHSEIDAITAAARNGISTQGCTIYVTRYPCEACAKAILAAGINEVVYGGTTQVSDETRQILQTNTNYVSIRYIPEWKEDLSDR